VQTAHHQESGKIEQHSLNITKWNPGDTHPGALRHPSERGDLARPVTCVTPLSRRFINSLKIIMTLFIKSLLTSLYQREVKHPSLVKRGWGRFSDGCQFNFGTLNKQIQTTKQSQCRRRKGWRIGLSRIFPAWQRAPSGLWNCALFFVVLSRFLIQFKEININVNYFPKPVGSLFHGALIGIFF
jgi:hypothetical protein